LVTRVSVRSSTGVSVLTNSRIAATSMPWALAHAAALSALASRNETSISASHTLSFCVPP
jgi:hypothetical protein